MARTFAALTTAATGTPERRVADAARAHPFLLSGTGREDLALMTAVPGLLCKAGAEGVHAGALPDGRSFAVKIDDGAARVASKTKLTAEEARERMARSNPGGRMITPEEVAHAVRDVDRAASRLTSSPAMCSGKSKRCELAKSLVV